MLDLHPQTIRIARHQGPGHFLGGARLLALKLAEHHPGDARMLGYELDVAQEHGLHGGQRRLDAGGGAFDPVKKPGGHPFHDRLPDGVLGGEMAEHGALGQFHVLGDGRGGDFGRIGLTCQRHDRFHRDGSALIGGQVLGMRVHRSLRGVCE